MSRKEYSFISGRQGFTRARRIINKVVIDDSNITIDKKVYRYIKELQNEFKSISKNDVVGIKVKKYIALYEMIWAIIALIASLCGKVIIPLIAIPIFIYCGRRRSINISLKSGPDIIIECKPSQVVEELCKDIREVIEGSLMET